MEKKNGGRRFRVMMGRCLKALSPGQYLSKARDMYVNGFTRCAGMADYSGIGVSPAPVMELPKSFSGRSSVSSSSSHFMNDDYSELVRAASARVRPTSSTTSPAIDKASVVRRSRTVSHMSSGIGRIDEETPCNFSASFKRRFADDNKSSKLRAWKEETTLPPKNVNKV